MGKIGRTYYVVFISVSTLFTEIGILLMDIFCSGDVFSTTFTCNSSLAYFFVDFSMIVTLLLLVGGLPIILWFLAVVWAIKNYKIERHAAQGSILKKINIVSLLGLFSFLPIIIYIFLEMFFI